MAISTARWQVLCLEHPWRKCWKEDDLCARIPEGEYPGETAFQYSYYGKGEKSVSTQKAIMAFFKTSQVLYLTVFTGWFFVCLFFLDKTHH